MTQKRQAHPQKTEHDNVRNKRDAEIASELLAIVRTLAEELHPYLRYTQTVALTSDLDRDLGLNSLGRAELILRLNRAFKVQLPEHLLGDANTPQDLLAALLTAGPVAPDSTSRGVDEAHPLPRIEAPSTAETFVQVLGFHAASHPDRPHLWLWHDENQEELLTYGQLHDSARRVAFGLMEKGLAPGDRVAIMLTTQAAFFEAFFGILYAGGIPIPVYPPARRSQVEDHLRRQASILNNAGTSILIVGEELQRVGSLLFGLAESLRHIETIPHLVTKGIIEAPMPATSQTIALIQYTSGSTGDPKGVVLTHANLLANIRAMGEVLRANSSDIFVSWLPLYHDMGLIGAWLGSLYFGVQAVIMSPLAFLIDPSRWLRALSRHRGTLSAAPNFAFELCCRNIRDKDMEGVDLSSLRMIVNGAEPVSASTIQRFTERFSQYGFRPEMMGPVYGLAENSVGLALPPFGRAPIIDRIQRTALSRDGEAVPAPDDDPTALKLVACGQPLPGHQVRIIDDAGRELPERSEGRLQFKGPSATSGYFRNQEKTRALFSGEWLESGDRAYLANGDIYITGRIKDMIIKAGRNIYPHEVEELVGQLPDVRKGCVAAVASKDPDTGNERLVLVVETRLKDKQAKHRLRQQISQTCTDTLDVPPDIIELVPPHTVPKTSSGKIRRATTRERYEAGLLTSRSMGLWLQLIRLVVFSLKSRGRRFRRRVSEVLFAGYWWATLVGIAALTWLLVLLTPFRNWRHGIVHIAARLFLWCTRTPLKVTTCGALPKRSAVLVANHSSYLDSVVIAAAIPGRLTFIAKEEVSRQWIAGPFLRRLGTLFAHRTVASGGIEDTKRQRQAVQAGARIMTFPEGTLTRMPGLLGFRLGAFLVATQEGLPVVPITLRGTRSILRGGQWFPRRGEITVHIDHAVLPDGRDFDAAVRLRDQTRSVLLERCGEPDLARERVTILSAS